METVIWRLKEEAMRRSLVGALLGAGFVTAITALPSSSEPVGGAPLDLPMRSGGSDLITHVSAADGLPQVVTVIDPRQRVLAVYHVDRATGSISFKSVRNITWDLQMTDYNSGDPLPQDIRNGLPR
jgi:hypothetical protein